MRTFGKFKLPTPGYESKEEEEESSSMHPVVDDKTITENILFKEFNQNPDDFEVFKDNGKLKVNCKPCNLCLQSVARNVLTKHYTSQKHENALKGKVDSIQVPPKKSPDPPVLKLPIKIKKRERKEEEEEFDIFFEKKINQLVEEEAKKKLKDETYITNLVNEECSFFDELFQTKQTERFLAQSYVRIQNKK